MSSPSCRDVLNFAKRTTVLPGILFASCTKATRTPSRNITAAIHSIASAILITPAHLSLETVSTLLDNSARKIGIKSS
jgi:hypothetical protein